MSDCKLRQRLLAVVLVGCFTATNVRPARAQAELLLPAACATGVGCLIVGVVVIAGVTYYVFQHQQTRRKYYLAIDDPEELHLWGKYRAKDGKTCTRMAAGRDHYYDATRRICYIKG